MSLPAPATCTPRVNTTFANTARVSQQLQTNVILPLKSGDTIELDGYRQTGEPDLITVNFQFDDTDFINNNDSVYIYVGDRAGTVVSVQEAHSTPSLVAVGINLVKRSGVVETNVVAGMDLNGASNTVQNGTIIGANAGLLANDSLRLDVLGSTAGVKGGVFTITIELA